MKTALRRLYHWLTVFYKKYFSRFLIALGALTLVYIIVATIIFLQIGRVSIPDKVILELDLSQPIVEYIPQEPLAQALGHDTTTVRDILDALQRAGKDERVMGLVAKLDSVPMGLAVNQEIRNAIMAFRSTKRFAVAYTDTFGEFGSGTSAYYLASAFDEIYMQPSGDINLTGLMYEVPFLKGTLEKFNIQPRMDHRKEYKNALNLFTKKKFTEPHKEAISKVMNSQFAQIIQGIAQAREITTEDLVKFFDEAPLSGEQAAKLKLVDALLYRDEVYEITKAKAKDAEFFYLSEYLKGAGRPHRSGPTIALIYGVGNIHRGTDQYNALSNTASMSSEKVASAFRHAVQDKDAKAIVFRVNSGGGSYVASDSIWRAVSKARQAGKPVIVSMGDVAGSGGYYVAMPANKIVAQPGTITGSIGVVAGKWFTRDFWEKNFGITWDEVHTSKNATLWTGVQDYTPAQWQTLQTLLDRIYEDFVSKVAEGRNMEKDKVREAAKGRIWTGEDAKALGLVDVLGGFDEALRLARLEIGLKADADITLTIFPRSKNLVQTLLMSNPTSSEPRAQMSLAHEILDQTRPLYKMVVDNGLMVNHGILHMPQIKQVW